MTQKASKDVVNFAGPEEGAVSLTHASRESLLADVATHLRDKRGFALATLNLDHVVKLKQDESFRAAYLKQTHVVADGNPIVWLSKRAGVETELMPGSDMIDPLVALAAQLGAPIAFLGSTEHTLEAAGKALQAKYPQLKIAAKIAPPYGFDPESDAAKDALQEIENSGALLCFLALGAPKQEMLAARGLSFAPSVGFVSIGAGLDFISGQQVRAPQWVRTLALEWLWRMLSNPMRLARRYMACIGILPGLMQAANRQGMKSS